MTEKTEYLLVVQAPCFRVDDQTFATESAFGEHLRVLRDKLAPRFRRIWIAAPRHSDAFYESNQSHLAHINEPKEQIFFVGLHRTESKWWEFWRRDAVPAWRSLRGLTRRAAIVHGGLASDVFRPSLLLANIAAGLDGCKTLFVVDIDFRRDAWRLWRTGQWSFKSFLLCRAIYDPIRTMQIRAASRWSSLLLLKSAALVRDFGGGRPNVHNFWDTAHSLEQVVEDGWVEQKVRRLLEEKSRPLSLVYFGRFVPYKGLALMIRAVVSARSRSGRAFVLDVIGAGPELPRLRELTRELGAEDAVRFHDPLPYGPALFSRVREADLMLATPLSEDTPRSAFDAMAASLPILAFDIDYYVSLSGETKAVCTSPWPDVEAFGQAIVGLDQDRVRFAAMCRAAADFARANTQQAWLDRRVAWTLSLLGDGIAAPAFSAG